MFLIYFLNEDFFFKLPYVNSKMFKYKFKSYLTLYISPQMFFIRIATYSPVLLLLTNR